KNYRFRDMTQSRSWIVLRCAAGRDFSRWRRITMVDNRIVRSNGSNGIERSSPAVLSVVYSLDLAAAIFGKELVPEEVDFWREALAGFKPEHITAAFREHCRTEMYFPRPAEIIWRIGDLTAAEAPSPGE